MTVPDVAPRPLASPEPLLQDLVLRLAPGVTAGAHPETVTTVAPFTGGPLARLPLSTPDDVLAAYAGARAAQRPWAKRSVRERAAVFLRLHDLVLERQDELLDLIQLEAQGPAARARGGRRRRAQRAPLRPFRPALPQADTALRHRSGPVRGR
jgi:succinate-semialdehyde dehydrogenase/glutarate-semialdehyde dehydrogenase